MGHNIQQSFPCIQLSLLIVQRGTIQVVLLLYLAGENNHYPTTVTLTIRGTLLISLIKFEFVVTGSYINFFETRKQIDTLAMPLTGLRLQSKWMASCWGKRQVFLPFSLFKIFGCDFTSLHLQHHSFTSVD